jgi:glycosyltransferase involved in cell wall biosynthesis
MARHRVQTGPERGVLHVIHGHGGGTEHHVRALIEVSRGGYRHYLAMAVGDAWQVEEHQDDGSVRSFNFGRRSGESWHDYVGGLCAVFGIGLIHLHNISGCRNGLIASVATLGVPYGYTIHDLNFACPTITFLGTDGMYCGAQTDAAVCGRCIAAQPEFAHIDIVAWRANHQAMLARAAFLVAPSRWAADTFTRYFPGHAIEVIPHGAPGVWATQDLQAGAQARGARPARLAVVLPDDEVPTVAVLGAIGPDKGARRIERMVDLVRARGLRVRFVLIGYLDIRNTAWQSDDAVFTVHGRYEARDLPDLLAHYRVRLVAYPSAGPETFSFTLSEAWAAGRPVIVPPFGALAERLAGTGAGWAWSDEEWRDEGRMLDRVAQLVAPEFAADLAAASRHARACPQPTLAVMAQRTLELYDNAMPSAASASRLPAPPLDAARVRDALGYVPWTPPLPPPLPAGEAALAQAGAPVPVVGAGAALPSSGMVGGMVRVALRWRHTLPGRILHRLTPTVILDALRARLS